MLLHCTVTGSGQESLIFLHSGLQTGNLDFAFQREYFKRHYKVYAPDLRGHGKSYVKDLSLAKYFSDCVNDLLETMDSYGIEKAHLIGCSLGGLIGLKFAKIHSDRLHSLIISGITSTRPDHWNALQKKDAAHQAALLLDEQAVHYFDQLHLSDSKKFLQETTETDWYPFEETGDIRSIPCPALLLVGEEKAQEVRGVIDYPEMNDHFHVAVLPFAGHLVHQDQPISIRNL
ncbi:pimeloyl-ACP methyl ester carboxylesterase [Sporosarcina luteola]|nr:pimeloyl-ACP methyl ester carboxylesterase [Sporosarcina luteola]